MLLVNHNYPSVVEIADEEVMDEIHVFPIEVILRTLISLENKSLSILFHQVTNVFISRKQLK